MKLIFGLLLEVIVEFYYCEDLNKRFGKLKKLKLIFSSSLYHKNIKVIIIFKHLNNIIGRKKRNLKRYGGCGLIQHILLNAGLS